MTNSLQNRIKMIRIGNKLNELDKIKEKTLGMKIKSRNQMKINLKTFKMKSHILLPSKLLSTQEESKKKEIKEKDEDEVNLGI